MTIHKSKGLEYPVIFLIGMVENISAEQKGKSGRRTPDLLCGYIACHEAFVSFLVNDLSGATCQKINFPR